MSLVHRVGVITVALISVSGLSVTARLCTSGPTRASSLEVESGEQAASIG
jgi:hypothetical protein